MGSLLEFLSHLFVRKKDRDSRKVRQTDSGRKPGSKAQTNFLAFDIKIAKPIPGGIRNWKSHRPVGICCAATVCNGHEPILWYSKNFDGCIASMLSVEDAGALFCYLFRAAEMGWRIVTWNGLGFDFNILAEESGEKTDCALLALKHYDLMFQIFCGKGYPVSMNKVASQLGIPINSDISGETAPVLWAAGEYDRVLQFTSHKVLDLLEIAKRGEKSGFLTWVSNNGTRQQVDLRKGWIEVLKLIKSPIPDTSWMGKPLKREEFLYWTREPEKKLGKGLNSYFEKRSSYNPSEDPSDTKTETGINRSNELDDDEINALFIQAELEDRFEFYPAQVKPTRNTPAQVANIIECPCPICQGSPNLDHVFMHLEEEEIERQYGLGDDWADDDDDNVWTDEEDDW